MPSYVDSQLYEDMLRAASKNRADRAIQGLSWGDKLTEALDGLKQTYESAFQPLPIVVSDRPDAMQIRERQQQAVPMPTAPMDTAPATPETPSLPPFKAEDFTFQDGRSEYKPSVEPGESVGSVSVASGPAMGSGTRAQKQARVYEVARANGLDDEAAKILVAVTETEGGLEGAIGDEGKSRGPFQFYEGGQMPGFRAWVQQQGIPGDPDQLVHNVDLATRYAVGYLGRAIAAGRAQGLSGANLATYVQANGQVSEHPERTGVNYQRMFGQGQPAPNAGASSPPAVPSSAPPAATAAPTGTPRPEPSQAAGGSGLVTIQNVDDGKTRQVPREQVPSWLTPVVPGMSPSWRVVDDGRQAQMSELDAARAGNGMQADALSLKGPLDDTPVRDRWADEPQQPYDPDQGAHEATTGSVGAQVIPPVNPDEGPRESGPLPFSPLSPNPEPVTPPAPRYDIQYANGGPPTPSGDWQEMPVRPKPAQVAQTDEPRYLDQSIPSPPGWQALTDAAGNVVDWIRERGNDAYQALEPVRRAAAELDGPPGYGQVQSFGPGEPDYVSQGGAVTRALNTPIRPPERREPQYGPFDLSGPEFPDQEARNRFQRSQPGLSDDAAAVPYQVAEATRSSIMDAAQAFAASLRAGEEGRSLAAAGNALWGAVQAAGLPWTVAARTINEMLPEANIAGVGPGDVVTSLDLLKLAINGTNGLRHLGENVLSPESMAQAHDIGAGAVGTAARAGRGLAEEAGRQLLEGPSPGSPMSAFHPGLSTRHVIPPEVADTLDFPVRVPDDPRVVRAIEAVGGRVNPEKGVDLYVTRAQSPGGAGQRATRGGVFYEAIPEGGRSSFAGSDNPNNVGGSQVIPRSPTRFRSPLILDAAPGEMRGFNQAAEQLGIRNRGTAEEIARAEEKLASRQRYLERFPQSDTGSASSYLAEAERELADLRDGVPVVSADIDSGIRIAKRAGPAGSPARAQALKDLVSRYGGDPDLIDDLLAIRGADASESAWAIKENILAANARKQGYDGVVTVQSAPEVLTHMIEAHPAVQAAQKAADEAYEAYSAAKTARMTAEYARQSGDYSGFPKLENGRRPTMVQLDRQEASAQNAWIKASEDLKTAKNQAREELSAQAPSKITELVDVREGRNPTPPNATDELKAAYRRVKDAEAKVRELMSQPLPVRATAMEEARQARVAAQREVQDAEQALDDLMNNANTAPGYELRADVPRRPETRASTIEENPRVKQTEQEYREANAAHGEFYKQYMDSMEGRSGVPFAEWARRTGNQAALDAEERARRASQAMGEAWKEPRYRTANAALPFDPASAAAGGAAGAMSEDEEGQQGDPLRTAAGMFLGAVAGTPQGRRLARRLAQQAQNAKPPNALEALQSYRHSVGMLGNPSTGIVNAIGGPVSIALGLPTEVIKTGIMRGYPVPVVYQAGSLVAGLKEASRDMLATAMGNLPQSVRNAPDFRPPPSERMAPGIGRKAAFAMETPGRLMTQTPDAFFNTLFTRWGRARAASDIVAEQGVSRLRPDQQVAEMNRLLTNPTPEEAQRIADSAKQFADEMTYKGEAGYWEKILGSPFRPASGPTTSADPMARQIHDLIGSHLMPYFGAIYKMHKLAASYVPVTGHLTNRDLATNERIARQLVGTAAGVWMMDAAAKNLITGPGPSDPDEKAALKANGWEEWSVYVPGVGYWPADDFAQAGPVLRAIGGYYDAERYATPQQKGDALRMADAKIKGALRSLERFPVVQAAQSVIAMAESPVKGGADFLTSVGSSYVPALVKANEASKDPYQRTVDPNAPLAEQIKERALNRVGSIPGVGSRQDSPPVIDRRGEPVPNPRAGMGAFIPQPRPERADPIQAEMNQYGVQLDKPRDRFAFTRAGMDAPDGAPGSVRVMLTPAEQQQWARYRSQKLDEEAARLKADRRYAGAPDGSKKAGWEAVIRAAEAYADRALKADIGRQALEERIRAAPAAEPVKKAS